MLTPGKVMEIRRLLASGNYSQRQVARITGVSRGTVGAIASGRRPDYPLNEPEEDEYPTNSPPVRCSGCGGWVYAPCRLCRVRARAQQQRLEVAQRRDYLRAAG